jgi:transcription elongation factor Elf1
MICQKCGGNLKVESTEKYDTVNRRVLVCKLCGWASGTEETFITTESTEKYDTVNRRVLVCKLCGWASGTEETFITSKPLKSRSVKMPESA